MKIARGYFCREVQTLSTIFAQLVMINVTKIESNFKIACMLSIASLNHKTSPERGKLMMERTKMRNNHISVSMNS